MHIELFWFVLVLPNINKVEEQYRCFLGEIATFVGFPKLADKFFFLHDNMILELFFFQVQYFACLIYHLCKRQRFFNTRPFPVSAIGFRSFLMAAFQFCLVEFQRFFFRPFGGVSHVAFPRFLHAIDSAGRTTPDEYFPEETASFLVLQSVNGKDFLAVRFRQSENRRRIAYMERRDDI